MTKQVQRRRGTATQHTSFTGAEGEISVNTTNKSVHVHDGTTAGGIEAARADLGNVSDADLNTALSGNTLASLTITSADINGGTIDGTVIGGTTAAAGSFTTLSASTSISGTLSTAAQPNVTSVGTLTSLDVSGDMTFGDNDKAIFGAGSDLQIYHDGSNSYIDDAGAGYLVLKTTGTGVAIQSSATGNLLIAEDTFVKLYNAGSQKLATTSTGVDVTGTLTSDGLTVDGNVGIGTSSPSATLHLKDWVGDGPVIRLDGAGQNSANTLLGALEFYNADNSADGPNVTGAIRHYSAESLGQGGYTTFHTHDGTEGGEGSDAPERMRIDSSGNVGIGTSSPQRNLQIGEYGTGSSTIAIASATNGYGYVVFGDSVAGDGVYRGAITYAHSNDAMLFNTAASEAMRIDSSGNLLVGGTSSGAAQAVTISGTGGYVQARAASSATGFFDRLTTDGDIAIFRKDGSTVGSIGADSGNLVLDGTDSASKTGLGFGGGKIYPRKGQTDNDNGVDLGDDNRRFKDLYLSGGVYLGGTGSANKLDDYEEGTWTPVVKGSTSDGTYTYIEQQGVYTKIGQQVIASFNLTNVTTSTAGSGDLEIDGLPFNINYPSGYNINAHGNVTVSYFGNGERPIFPVLQDGTDKFKVYLMNTSSTNDVMAITDKTSNSADIRGFVIYQTNS
jgi:hypothetical protein